MATKGATRKYSAKTIRAMAKQQPGTVVHYTPSSGGGGGGGRTTTPATPAKTIKEAKEVDTRARTIATLKKQGKETFIVDGNLVARDPRTGRTEVIETSPTGALGRVKQSGYTSSSSPKEVRGLPETMTKKELSQIKSKETRKRILETLRKQGKEVTEDKDTGRITAIARGRQEIIIPGLGQINIPVSAVFTPGSERFLGTGERFKPPPSKFETMAELPFGEAQRVTVSEAKKEVKEQRKKELKDIARLKKEGLKLKVDTELPQLIAPTQEAKPIQATIGEERIRELESVKLPLSGEEFKREISKPTMISAGELTEKDKVLFLKRELKEKAFRKGESLEKGKGKSNLLEQAILGIGQFELEKTALLLSTIETKEKRKQKWETAKASFAVAGLIASLPVSPLVGVGLLGAGVFIESKRFKEISKELDPEKRRELIASEIINIEVGIAAGAVGGYVGSKVQSTFGTPEKYRVTQPKDKDIFISEKAVTKAGIKKQRIGLRTEEKIRVGRTDVKEFTKKIDIPRDERFADILLKEDVGFEFRLNKLTGKVEQVLVRRVPTSERIFKVEPTAFKVVGKGKVEIVSQEGVTQIKGLDIERFIDPTQLKLITKEGITIGERTLPFKPTKGTTIKTIELGMKGKITDIFKLKEVYADLSANLGIDLNLFPPTTAKVPVPTTAPLIFTVAPVTPFFIPIFVPPVLITERERDIDFSNILKGKLITEQEREISQKKKPILDTERIIEQGLGSGLILDTAQEGKRKGKTIPILDITPITEQEEEVVVITEPETRIRQLLELEEPIEEEPRPIPFFIALEEKRERKREEERLGYNTSVRKKGKFIKVNIAPQTRLDALSMGARQVDNTPAAEFKVTGIKVREEPKSKYDNYFTFNDYKFRNYRVSFKGKKQEQLDKDRFVEKRAYRLDTPGELKGITTKGQRAIRRQGLLKGSASFNFKKIRL